MNRPPAKILVIEDAPDMHVVIKATLSSYRLSLAASLAQARALIEAQIFDLYVLDVLLPDGDSLGLCAELRKDPATSGKPILFISARSSEFDKLSAFAKGADDYITKPFSVLELRARVQAKLRGFETAAMEQFTHGPLFVDLAKRRVVLHEAPGRSREIKLTKIEFKLLVCLCERPEVVKSRQELLDQVWGTGLAVTDRTVDVHIHKMRKKLGSFAGLIEAHHGHGYVFKPGSTSGAA